MPEAKVGLAVGEGAEGGGDGEDKVAESGGRGGGGGGGGGGEMVVVGREGLGLVEEKEEVDDEERGDE